MNKAKGLSDSQLLRYSRHILLPEIDIAGQETLLAAKIFIIGAGGLGSPAAMYLASSGIGEITLCDHDFVDASNLQRQIVHDLESLGINKARSAARRLRTMSPDTRIRTLESKASEALLRQEIPNADIVLDCTDNFPTRYLINKICFEYRTPLISGAAIGFQGQVLSLDFRRTNSPCYACVFPDSPDAPEQDMSCALFGVFSPLVGIIGSTQAAAALRLLLSLGDPQPSPRLHLYQALRGEWRSLDIERDPQCPVCGVCGKSHD